MRFPIRAALMKGKPLRGHVRGCGFKNSLQSFMGREQNQQPFDFHGWDRANRLHDRPHSVASGHPGRIAVTPNLDASWVEKTVGWQVKYPGAYVCDKDRFNLMAREEYFYASQNVNNQYDISIQAVNMVMRGRRDLNRFLTSIQGYTKPEQANTLEAVYTFDKAKQFYASLSGPLPGVIMYPFAKQHLLKGIEEPQSLEAPGLLRNIGQGISSFVSSVIGLDDDD